MISNCILPFLLRPRLCLSSFFLEVPQQHHPCLPEEVSLQAPASLEVEGKSSEIPNSFLVVERSLEEIEVSSEKTRMWIKKASDLLEARL